MAQKITALVATLLVAVPFCAAEAGPLLTDAIATRLESKVELGVRLTDLTIQNLTDEFICFYSSVSDSSRGFVRLRDASGRIIPFQSFSEGAPPNAFERGFNFGETYYFLRPHHSMSLGIDVSNFRVPASGKYRYEIVFPYVRCRDASDPHAQITEYPAHGEGTVFIEIKSDGRGH